MHEDVPAGAQSRGKEGQRDAHYGREVCALLVRNAAEAMCRAWRRRHAPIDDAQDMRHSEVRNRRRVHTCGRAQEDVVADLSGYDTHVDVRTHPFPPNEIIRRAGDDEFMRASMSSTSAPELPTPWPAPSRMLQTGSVLVLLGHEPHVARAGCARVLRPHEDAPYLLALRE